MLCLRASPPAGSPTIHRACQEAIELAQRIHAVVVFEFNGVDVYAGPMDTATDIADAWGKDMRRAASRPEGP